MSNSQFMLIGYKKRCLCFFRCLLRIPCITYSINYFQQKIPNHLNQFLCRNPSTLSGFVVVLSLFFLLIYIQCLEFWLSIWQKSNKKQNEVFKSSLKTLDRLWDLTMGLKKTKQKQDWLMTKVCVNCNLNHSRELQNTQQVSTVHQKSLKISSLQTSSPVE